MRQSLLSGCLFAVAFALSPQASAFEVAIDKTRVELVGPPGYCPLDAKHPLDVRLIDIVQQPTQGRNELLAVFVDCARLSAWRNDKTDDLGDTFDYQVSLRAKGLSTKSSGVTELCTIFRKQGAATIKDAEGRLATSIDAIKEFAGKLQLNSIQPYGVLRENNTGCFYGTVQKFQSGDKVETLFNVTTITALKEKLVFVNHGSTFKDEKTIQRLLTTSEQTVAKARSQNR
jgi:hypothetical protein